MEGDKMAENLTPDGDAEEQEKKSLIGRFIAWLEDSYNGAELPGES